MLKSLLHGLMELDDLDATPAVPLFAMALHRLDVDTDSVSSWVEVRSLDVSSVKTIEVEGRINSVRFSPDGSFLVFTEEHAGDTSLRIYTLADGVTRTLHSSRSSLGVPAISPDGARVAVCVGATGAVESVVRITASSLNDEGLPSRGASVLVLAVTGEVLDRVPLPASSCTWTQDGAALLCIVPRIEDALLRSDLFESRPGGAPKRLETGLVWVCSVKPSPLGRSLVLIGTDQEIPSAGHPVMRAFVYHSDAALPARRLSDALVMVQQNHAADSGVAWVEENRFLVRTAESGNIRLSLFTLDGARSDFGADDEQVTHFARSARGVVVATATSRTSLSVRLTEANRTRALFEPNSEFDAWFAACKSSRYALRVGDRHVRGRLLQPPSLTSRRLLISMHGGPHGFVGPGVSQTHLYRWLAASRGWNVLALDPSGSGTWGDEHVARIRGRWGTLDLEETEAAVDDLVAKGLVDSDKVAVSGFSYGGYLAASALAKTNRFRCAVLGAPVANLQTWYVTSDIGMTFLNWEFDHRTPGFWQRLHNASPVHRVRSVSAPTLIVQGTSDRRCPPAQAAELWAGLRDSNGRSELVMYEAGSHSFPASGRPSHRIDYHQRVVEFCERHVGAIT